jgi:membrane protein implicated in regulation of membrane protease activity
MTALAFDPWVWAAIAVGLAILEMLLPGYVLLGFGAAALVVAGWLALIPHDGDADWRSLFALLSIWSGLAIVLWWVLSKITGVRVRQRQAGKEDINDFESKG